MWYVYCLNIFILLKSGVFNGTGEGVIQPQLSPTSFHYSHPVTFTPISQCSQLNLFLSGICLPWLPLGPLSTAVPRPSQQSFDLVTITMTFTDNEIQLKVVIYSHTTKWISCGSIFKSFNKQVNNFLFLKRIIAISTNSIEA